MPPALCAITGTILDASGVGVANVSVRLTPKARDRQTPEAFGGVGLLLDPVEVLTDEDGVFTISTVQGFGYHLDIEAIGLYEDFVAPASASLRFDLLGVVPVLEQLVDWTDTDGVVRVAATVRAPRVDTARERFDSITVERSPTGAAGPWTELDTIDLVPGLTTYTVEDALADGETATGTFYRARYIKTASADVSDYTDAFAGAADDEFLAITVDELKEIYLLGVRLETDDGQPYPQRMFEHYIRAAVDQLSRDLDIPIAPVEIVDEVHDHYPADYGQWGYFRLNYAPVIELKGVSFQYPSMTESVEINLDWVMLEEGGASGVVQIVPGRGNIADVLLIPGALMPMWSGGGSRVPGIWHFSYRAGFEARQLPAAIKHAIGMMASFGPFNIAGDLLGGAGIASFSVSTPGLSQSVNTTSSAENSGYSGRLKEYERELKELIPMLKRAYGKTARLTVV